MMLHVALFQLPDLIKSLVLRNSIHCSKFNIEDQCAVWWDGWWRTLAAVTARKKERKEDLSDSQWAMSYGYTRNMETNLHIFWTSAIN